jgi:hypothetical protein
LKEDVRPKGLSDSSVQPPPLVLALIPVRDASHVDSESSWAPSAEIIMSCVFAGLSLHRMTIALSDIAQPDF